MTILTTWAFFIVGLILYGLWIKHQNTKHIEQLANEDRAKHWKDGVSYYFVNGKLTIDSPRKKK